MSVGNCHVSTYGGGVHVASIGAGMVRSQVVAQFVALTGSDLAADQHQMVVGRSGERRKRRGTSCKRRFCRLLDQAPGRRKSSRSTSMATERRSHAWRRTQE